MKKFNVINFDFNNDKFIYYDIIPYLVHCYKEEKNKPKTFEEFKEFIERKSLQQWWSRCEYEIILSPWPYTPSPSESYNKKGEDDIEAWKDHWKEHLNECQKIDVHYQVMMNLDIITALVMDSVTNG